MSNELAFPWSETPVPGQAVEIAPGLLWARLPLPFRLNHVNVWILAERRGWTVIDTGCAHPGVFAAWEVLLAEAMQGRPPQRVIATHGHVDHIGLAGWMLERFDADFVGTFAEWTWARVSHSENMPRASQAHRDFLVRHGFDDSAAAELVAGRRKFVELATPLPGWINEIRDGQLIEFGGREWRVIVTGGHAFAHAAFYDAEANILIAGDHILPGISPVIAVYEMMPHADPLADYLKSFSQFDDIPDDVLVLPSHGIPYRGIRQRIGQLRTHHERRLGETKRLLASPRTALDLSRAMFPRVEGANDIGFALGETLAHVNHLLYSGEVEEQRTTGERSLFATAKAV